MAVTLETKGTYNTNQILTAFYIDGEVIKAFEAKGYSISITATSLKVFKGNQPQASIPVKAGAALFAIQGKLAASSLQSVAHKIMSVITPLIGEVQLESASAKIISEAKKKKAVEVPTSIPYPDTDTKQKSSGAVTGTTKAACLGEATKLHQKVQGTNTGSRYVVIALSPDLNVAARYKGHSLSIRVEGDVKKHVDRLKAAGFDGVKAANYASMHLQCDSDVMARRAASSVLGGMDMQFSTAWPDFKKMSEGV